MHISYSHLVSEIIAQRVNDLLRDKLHYQSSQLAEAKGRVRELEEGEMGRLGEIVTILDGSGPDGEVGGLSESSHRGPVMIVVDKNNLAEKIREVVEKLANHEHQTVEIFAEVAATEARNGALSEGFVSELSNSYGLIHCRTRLEGVKWTLAQREKEVEGLTRVRDACVYLYRYFFFIISTTGLFSSNRTLETRIKELEALNLSTHRCVVFWPPTGRCSS